MSKPILENIDSLDQLSDLNSGQLEQLCSELREKIISTVSETGGHLGASLGVVELTVALHLVFNSPKDKIIWDVGHQAYVHKLLTGRLSDFHTLRQKGGISGFPKRSENEHDMFGVGHASTSISAALGFAIARDIKGTDEKVIAVIGDGSMSGGLAFEAMNNAGQVQPNMIVVLNDNEMSISPNVGALAKYLTRITSGQLYTRFEADLWKILGKLPHGGKAQKLAHRVKEGLKQLVVPTILFEELGFKYFGPIDGHDIDLLAATLNSVQQIKGPILLHVVTKKGKGYSFAEREKAKYHGVGRFDKTRGLQKLQSSVPSYTSVFDDTIVSIAEEDKRVVAITAAMPDGTGLGQFMKKYPERFFDVGIAEGHAVTFAAGLACQGLKPIVAIYSTFLQRAYDQIIHDVALQKLPVVFAIDRGGLVGEDGPTHHGVLDLSFMRLVPDIVVMAPRDGNQLKSMLRLAFNRFDGPSALRYPRGAVPDSIPALKAVDQNKTGLSEQIVSGRDVCFVAIGTMVSVAVEVARQLKPRGVDAEVIDARFIKPLDQAMCSRVISKFAHVFTLEENSICGGLGSSILEWAAANKMLNKSSITNIAVPDRFIEHGTRDELLTDIGLTAESVLSQVISELPKSIVLDQKASSVD
ncbi:MAG: 1-deoxy-D-xylulose-5-phosphate synthase [bacterium]|nr:1-deoxy-D-xylulose-5-phosphate synthase [bacterium]MCP4799858.1 1-deoxy-D-xylulose-5-phosphate synthase [bacterium]